MISVRKFLLVIFMGLLVFASVGTVSHAINWVTTNQKTISWEPPTTLVDGSPIPAGDTIEYNVYVANAVTDPDKLFPGLATVTPIAETTYTFIAGVEGKFYIGVQVVRTTSDGEVLLSQINWSDTNGVYTPDPFGIKHYVPTDMVKGLAPQ